MRAFIPTLCALLLSALAGTPHPATFAQKVSLPPGLHEDSTVQEILEHLNRTTLPAARIVLRTDLPGDPTYWDNESGYDYAPSRLLIFSQGFKIASGPDDCHLKLRNEDVTVYDSNYTAVNLTPVTNSQAPHAAEFSVWLETVSHDKGKGPSLRHKKPEVARLVGSWQSEFQSRGSFGRTIFGVRFPALGGDQYRMSNTAAFAFDDRQSSERFDAAFRRLIKLCQPRSTKPRWRR